MSVLADIDLVAVVDKDKTVDMGCSGVVVVASVVVVVSVPKDETDLSPTMIACYQLYL